MAHLAPKWRLYQLITLSKQWDTISSTWLACFDRTKRGIMFHPNWYESMVKEAKILIDWEHYMERVMHCEERVIRDNTWSMESVFEGRCISCNLFSFYKRKGLRQCSFRSFAQLVLPLMIFKIFLFNIIFFFNDLNIFYGKCLNNNKEGIFYSKQTSGASVISVKIKGYLCNYL